MVIDTERLWRHAAAIASWRREAASEGEAAAFAYLAAELTALGLEPDLRRIPAWISVPRDSRLCVDGQEIPSITHAMAVGTPDGGLTAELIAGGVDPHDGWRGRAVAFRGLATTERVAAAQRAGASAALFVSEDRVPHEMIVSRIWGSPGVRELGELPAIPVVSVASRDWSGAAATLELTTVVDTGWRAIPQLVVDIAPAEPDRRELVLCSGHVDAWHHGAMDNAGANAVLLELARIFAARRHALARRLRLCFWSGHSHGRYAGSAAYVDAAWEELEEHCVAHVNIDSVGARGATVLTEAPSMPCTYAIGAEAIAVVTGQALRPVRFARAGDQSLVNLGVSSLFLTLSEQPLSSPDRLHDSPSGALTDGAAETGGLGWWWHTPQDTIDKLDPLLLDRDARVYLHALARLLEERELPLDVAAAARVLHERLAALPACDGVDLVALVDRARDLAALVERAQRQHDPRLLAVSRIINRLLHAEGDPTTHDPITPRPLLPRLRDIERLATLDPDGAAAHHLRIDIVRACNHIKMELRTAMALLAA